MQDSWFATRFLRSKIATIVAGGYLLAFVCAALYPRFDHRTFSGLAAVILALPWVDHLPRNLPASVSMVVCAILNAVVIYVVIAAIAMVLSMVRQAERG